MFKTYLQLRHPRHALCAEKQIVLPFAPWIGLELVVDGHEVRLNGDVSYFVDDFSFYVRADYSVSRAEWFELMQELSAIDGWEMSDVPFDMHESNPLLVASLSSCASSTRTDSK